MALESKLQMPTCAAPLELPQAVRTVFVGLAKQNFPLLRFSAAEFMAAREAYRKQMAPMLLELIGQPFATDIDILDFMASEYHWTPEIHAAMPDATTCALLKSAARRISHQRRGGQADRKTDNPGEKSGVPREAGRLLRLANKIKMETKKPGVRKIDVALKFNEYDRRKAENDLRSLRRYPHLLEE